MHDRRTQIVLVCLLWLTTALFVIPTWGATYWDFGDGNYLYVGRRLNEGLVPYRDILAPQPPLHLLMCAWSQRIGGWLGNDLLGARVYCLLTRLAASGLVYLCSRRLFGCVFRALLATAIYLAMPIGFWWSLCLQSENLEVALLLAAFLALLRPGPRSAALAGVASALAMHTNMTAVPYFIVNAIFLACRRPRLLAWYAGTGLGVWGAGAAIAYAWAGDAYISNVILNQVGSFPREEILGYPFAKYAWDKVTSQSLSVLRLEGHFLAAAFVSMALCARDAQRNHERGTDESLRWEYALWSAIGMMLSIGFTMKGGTVDYIFVLGEPAVALFAADAVVRFARAAYPSGADWRTLRIGYTMPFLRALAATIVIVGIPLTHPGTDHLRRILNEEQAELPESSVRAIADVIETYTKPGDEILAPPFYAYITGRTVAGELAENYLWNIKFINEVYDLNANGAPEGEGILKMREIAAMLRRAEVPLVLLDLEQTGSVPLIESAIEEAYQPIERDAIRSRNTPLGFYIPKGRAIRHTPLLPPKKETP